MARHRLGQSARPRADFDRATRWLDAHPNLESSVLSELKSFRTEAETVLARNPVDRP
jgi:hypothetical protein